MSVVHEDVNFTPGSCQFGILDLASIHSFLKPKGEEWLSNVLEFAMKLVRENGTIFVMLPHTDSCKYFTDLQGLVEKHRLLYKGLNIEPSPLIMSFAKRRVGGSHKYDGKHLLDQYLMAALIHKSSIFHCDDEADSEYGKLYSGLCKSGNVLTIPRKSSKNVCALHESVFEWLLHRYATRGGRILVVPAGISNEAEVAIEKGLRVRLVMMEKEKTLDLKKRIVVAIENFWLENKKKIPLYRLEPGMDESTSSEHQKSSFDDECFEDATLNMPGWKLPESIPQHNIPYIVRLADDRLEIAKMECKEKYEGMIEIKKSTIPHAGFGLFLSPSFQKPDGVETLEISMYGYYYLARDDKEAYKISNRVARFPFELHELEKIFGGTVELKEYNDKFIQKGKFFFTLVRVQI